MSQSVKVADIGSQSSRILPVQYPIRPNQFNRASGFTLVEIAIVIVLIAVLAGIAVQQFGSSQRAAEISATKQMLAELKRSVGVYATEQGRMPDDFKDFVAQDKMAPNHVISLASFADGSCKNNGKQIDCPKTAMPDIGTFSFVYHSPEYIELNCPQCQ